MAGRPLVMIGQPMDASGFQAQVKLFEDRTVVTYDPRGLGRSKRKDGGVTNEPETQAEDVHAIIEALGAGPVEMLASSGGAVTALALVTAYPHDVSTLVAHEPPIDCVLPDAEAVQRARAAYTQVYQDKGWGAGMAAFIAMTSWEGEVTDEYLAQPAPDPAAFGMPTEDDGTREDPLLSDRSWAVTTLPARSRGPEGGADPDRGRGRGGVGEGLHRSDRDRVGRTARPAGDGLPQPPRRLHGWRVRLRRPARGLRRQAPRGTEPAVSPSAPIS